MKYLLIGLLLAGCICKKEITREQRTYLASLKIDERVFMDSCLENHYNYYGCMSQLAEWKKLNMEIKQ